MKTVERTQQLVQGTVIRRSGQKSVVVEISRTVKHPQVGKYLRRRSRFHVHDPADTCGIGDLVEIRACRPLSATKHWILRTILKKGALTALPAELT